MFYTVYKTTNLINQKFYIGFHQTTDPNDDYLGSGRLVADAIKKYGKKNFKKEVLFIFDNEADMIKKEIELVTEDLVHDSNCYNLTEGGCGGNHIKHMSKEKYEERSSKISASIKLYHKTVPDTKKNIHKKNISKSKKKAKSTQKNIEAIADARRGKTYEELYGAERATEINEKRKATFDKNPDKEKINQKKAGWRKGKTYEELYGPERAAELREARRQNALKNKLGVK